MPRRPALPLETQWPTDVSVSGREMRFIHGPVAGHTRYGDAHHAFVFVIDRMAVIDKVADDYRIGERDDDLEHAGPLIGCRRH
jgi:hypothetical protein